MTCDVVASNTEMGVVSDSYRISLIYSVYNFSIRTIIYIIAYYGAVISQLKTYIPKNGSILFL